MQLGLLDPLYKLFGRIPGALLMDRQLWPRHYPFHCRYPAVADAFGAEVAARFAQQLLVDEVNDIKRHYGMISSASQK